MPDRPPRLPRDRNRPLCNHTRSHSFVRARQLGFRSRPMGAHFEARSLSAAIPETTPHWQSGFFDHLIRHSESYAEKWEYVCRNPVRAGFVKDCQEWPWQGEIERLEA